MKQPCFQFYPSKWLGDTALQSCSAHAIAAWINIMCLMHDGSPYGHLTFPNGTKIDPKTISKLANIEPKKLQKVLDELVDKRVIYQNEDGVFYSKKMVEDEEKRQAWRERQGKHRGRNSRDFHPENECDVTPDVTPLSQPTISISLSNTSVGVSAHEEIQIPSEVEKTLGEYSKILNPAIDYLKKSGNPNLLNFGWVRGLVATKISEIRKLRPDMGVDEILSCWRQTCDDASEKGRAAPNWFATVFVSRCREYRGETGPIAKSSTRAPATRNTRISDRGQFKGGVVDL